MTEEEEEEEEHENKRIRPRERALGQKKSSVGRFRIHEKHVMNSLKVSTKCLWELS